MPSLQLYKNRQESDVHNNIAGIPDRPEDHTVKPFICMGVHGKSLLEVALGVLTIQEQELFK